MAELDTIVQVTITATTQFPTRAGFGTPLIAAFHTVFPERVREYASTTEMTADGFLINDPVVRAAAKVFGQTPRPPTLKIGRRAGAPIQSILFTPKDFDEGVITSFNVVSPDGTVTAITRTNGAAETAATIATALAALVGAISGVTTVDNTGSFNANADTAGDLFDYNTLRGGLDILDATPDPTILIATDLAAIDLEDPDWYALGLDSNSKAEIAGAAGFIEPLTKIFIPNSADSEVRDDVSGNIAETLNAATRQRSGGIWSESILSYAGLAWLGKQLPTDPGSSTWKFKTLNGVVADDLTTTERANIESNEWNHYQRVSGVDITAQGTMADGDFIDIQRTIDALSARIQEDIAAILFNRPKLPFTDKSVSLILSTIRGVLRSFQDTGALDPETDPTITAPAVADVAAADRANRLLPDVEFTARLAGAIHKVEIQGTLTV